MTNDLAQSAQYIESNQYNYDENTLPTDRLKQLQAKYGERDQALADAVDVLLRHEPADRAVQQPEGAAGRQLRDQPADAGQPARRSRCADVELPASDVSAVQEDHARPAYPYNLSKAKQLVQQSGTARDRPSASTRSPTTRSTRRRVSTSPASSTRSAGRRSCTSSPAPTTSSSSATRRRRRRSVDRLVRGLPVPHRLVPGSPVRPQHHAAAQQQQLERQLQGHEQRRSTARPPASVEGLLAEHDERLGGARQEAHGQVREPGSVPERRHHVVLLVEDGSELRRLHRPVRRSGTDVPEVMM